VGGRPTTLGRLPALALTSALGLLAVTGANLLGPGDPSLALIAWWCGVMLIWLPVTVRLWGREAGPAERAALVVLLGASLYLVHLVVYPGELRDPDEFSHLRTWADISADGRLFTPNPLLLVSPSYPGLETVTVGTGLATDLPVTVVGPIVVLLARVMLMLGLFLTAWETFRSARIAGLAAAIYTTNASFVFFQSAWSYESVALPLAVIAIWAVHGWWSGRDRRLYVALASCSIAAVAVTHHLTSLVLTAMLLIWAVVAVARPTSRSPRPIVRAALWAMVVAVAWMLTSGRSALEYLGEIVGDAVAALAGLTVGGSGARVLFGAPEGFRVPGPEVALTWIGQALLVLVLFVACIHVLRRHRRDPLVVVFLIAAAIYPATLVMRLTGAGAETSQRASEFLFLGMAPIIADGLVHLHRRLAVGRPLVVPVLACILAGGVILGTAWYLRFRGPYRVAAEQLAVETQGVSAAWWTHENLGPHQRIVTDRTNQKLQAGLGLQDTVTAYNSGVGPAYALWGPSLTAADVDTLRRGRVEYVLADARITEELPVFPYYFEAAEPEGGQHRTPWPLAGLVKLDGADGTHRVFDSGDIVIHDVRELVDALP